MFQQSGSFRLFRIAGITVYLHSLWFVVAIFEISSRNRYYSSISWNIAEYLGLFLIVLLHEFGHALACRQVGGTADRILLWPLGGVAYVSPPARPGATLWSIAAGPLVNVVVAGILFAVPYVEPSLLSTPGDARMFLRNITIVNWMLLLFNLLPVYPLDGGQILRSLLWFVFGRARSLSITAWIGFVGVIALFAIALKVQSTWLGVVALYMLFRCWKGLQAARALGKLESLPRRPDFACPSCSESPQVGNFWKCKCGMRFDTFATQATCPQCGTQYPKTTCFNCQTQHPMSEWKRLSAASSSA